MLPPARAQYPGGGGSPGDGGACSSDVNTHCWQVSYQATSGTASDDTYSNGTVTPYSSNWPTTVSSSPINYYLSPGGSGLDASESGSVTATLTWVPYTNETSQQDPAPTNVIVEEQASASATGGMDPSQNQASDGLGDPNNSGTSSGTLYVLANGASGTITISDSLAASTPATRRRSLRATTPGPPPPSASSPPPLLSTQAARSRTAATTGTY